MYFGARHSYEMEQEIIGRQARLIQEAAHRRLVKSARRPPASALLPEPPWYEGAAALWHAAWRGVCWAPSAMRRRVLRPRTQPATLW